ncbi:hypothetical protein [Terricaulis silvestris]|uniref:Uncharacterized protein n=1 Tax=Terricaulis silvestris TaxID=2686094 RepID=A0A6I6MKX2_9CAUL|nr:hypothetical protein [Terricaulis silvestris]QGZ93888.1 hypothetical protein DSM104635_00702 [Terricaulis silvestris]
MHDFTAPAPIADLWKSARAVLADALSAFGGPQQIQRTLDRIARSAIRRQLKALEVLVMKLLLIEAAKLPAVTKRAHAAPNGQGRSAHAADPARPETWRVCFQLHIPPEPKDTGPRIRGFGPSRLIRAVVVDANTFANRLAAMRASISNEERDSAAAARLARRFEALRRVFANPAPRARRLKHKLIALKQRAFAAARRIVAHKPPPRQLDPILLDRTRYAAEHAPPAFDTG